MARQYFFDKKLWYDKISQKDIEDLCVILNKVLSKSNYFISINIPTIRSNGNKIIDAFVTGKSSINDEDEIISFWNNGFIGFCNNANQKDTKLITDSFIEWCDKLINRSKNGKT